MRSLVRVEVSRTMGQRALQIGSGPLQRRSPPEHRMVHPHLQSRLASAVPAHREPMDLGISNLVGRNPASYWPLTVQCCLHLTEKFYRNIVAMTYRHTMIYRRRSAFLATLANDTHCSSPLSTFQNVCSTVYP